MKKGLIIGNSHVAMIAKSWREKADRWANTELTFFAQPGEGPKGIGFDGTILQATDPEFQAFLKATNTSPSVDLTDHDFLAIVACGVSFYPTAEILCDCHVWGWPSCAQIMAKGIQPTDKQLISAHCLNTTLQDMMKTTLAWELAQKLRAKTAMPIFIIPQPLPSERISTMKGKGHRFHKIDKYNNNEPAYQAFTTAVTTAFSLIENTSVLTQPTETIVNHIYTHQNFTAGAVRLYNLDKEQADQDTLHANPDYGSLILDKLTSLILQ